MKIPKIKKTLAILSNYILYIFFLQLKYLSLVMSYDILALKFQGIDVIISWNELKKCEKEILLLDNNAKVYEKLITIFKKIFAVFYIIVKNLAFF